MKRSCVLVLLLLVAPAMALAQDAPQPNYPPGYDCASVPAGSQREACEASQLEPKVDNDLDGETPHGQQTFGTVSPPTIPEEPDDETRDSGPGTEGGAGGVGN